MGSEEKCPTWFRNICEKVETLYSEIDTIISQESLKYAESQFLTAGANVKQFTENQVLTAGANVKQFCSEFMQDVLPEFLKDSLLEKAQSEDTETCDSSSCEILKKDNDEGHKHELSELNSHDGISASGFSTVGKEISLEQNHKKVTLIPSEIPLGDLSGMDDVGMKEPLGCGVDHSCDGGIDDQIDLQSPKSILRQASYSSAKAGGTAEPEVSNVDSLTLHHYAIGSAGSDECKILETENDSADEPGDGKQDQAKDNHTSEIVMKSTEQLTQLTMNHDYRVLYGNKICTVSDFEVEDPTFQALDNFPLKVKLEKGWEFIQKAGYEAHHVESDQPQPRRLKQSLKPREPKSNNDSDSCESDWEIV